MWDPHSISLQDLYSFHAIERVLFARLVITMKRDPLESMEIISFWLWLEYVGFPNIIKNMLPLSSRLISLIMEEAKICLACLKPNVEPTADADTIPITMHVLQGALTLQFISENKEALIKGVSYYLDNVCSKIFNDILLKTIAVEGQPSAASSESRPPPPPPPPSVEEEVASRRAAANVGQLVMLSTGNWNIPVQELLRGTLPIPIAAPQPLMWPPELPLGPPPHTLIRYPCAVFQGGFMAPLFVGGMGPQVHVGLVSPPRATLGDSSQTQLIGLQEEALQLDEIQFEEPTRTALNPLAKPFAPEDPLLQDDRTLFLTFSRGYPLTAEDVQRFFAGKYGDIIQSVHLQQTAPGVQPLFARLVLFSSNSVGVIMGRQEKAKYAIRGKHVWVRRYIPKRHRVGATQAAASSSTSSQINDQASSSQREPLQDLDMEEPSSDAGSSEGED